MFSLFATLPSCHVSKLPHHLLKLLSMNFLLAMSYNNMSWGCCSPKMNKLEQARLNGPLEPLSMLHTCSRAWQGCGQGRLLPSPRLLLPFALLLLCFALLCLLACLHFSCPLLVLLARPSEILLLLLLNNNNNKNDKKKKKKKKNALAMLV